MVLLHHKEPGRSSVGLMSGGAKAAACVTASIRIRRGCGKSGDVAAVSPHREVAVAVVASRRQASGRSDLRSVWRPGEASVAAMSASLAADCCQRSKR